MKGRGRIAALLFLFGMLAGPAAPAAAPPPDHLRQAAGSLAAEFGRLDAGLRQAARELGVAGLTGDGARAALAALCGRFDYAVDCAAVDRRGRMVTVEPAAWRHHEGADISGQAQVRRLWETGKPVLSGPFLAVEGFTAVDAEHPVTDPAGRLLGSVSLLFRPERLLGPLVAPLVRAAPGEGHALWVMDTEGRILYDVDTPQVGLDLFSDPLYRPYDGLVRLGRRIAREPEGEGSYDFLRRAGDGEVVTKRARWRSVSLYGTAWRLVAIRVEPAGAPRGERPSGFR